MTSFERALMFVLSWEGGYSADSRDPGGETHWGISKRAYPALDITNLTKKAAGEIYKHDYWDACQCGKLPYPVALMVFDIAVNQGVSTASYLLQEALGVKQDGMIGMVTISTAIRKSYKEVVPELAALRCQRYSAAKNVGIYGKGWFRRAAACLMMAVEPQ